MVPKLDKMCKDVKAYNTTADGGLLSAEIANAIAALKAGADWPKSVKTPAFRDEAANIYLNIVPKKMAKINYSVIARLPHPLSMNRRVCYIGNDVETEDQQDEVTQKLQEQGVLGAIKIVRKKILASSVRSKDEAALKELAEIYDTYFVCRTSYLNLFQKIKPYFVAQKKLGHPVLNDNSFRNGLEMVGLFENSSKKGYIVKVGHAGFTNEQLQENIAHVLNLIKLKKVSAVSTGLAGVKQIQVKTGKSRGVAIYKADSEDKVNEDELEPASPDEVVIEDELEPALSAEAIADGIAKLKAAAAWPEEPTTPPFKSESDTVYLNFLTKKLTTLENQLYTLIYLPHPLSKNRRLCYIGSDVDIKEKKSEIKQKFRDRGIEGKITIVPGSLVEGHLVDNDEPALNEFAKHHDSFFVDARCKFVVTELSSVLVATKKFSMPVYENFNVSFSSTAMWVNPSEDGLFIKVGHTGLTDKQLQENIAFAVNTLRFKYFFPNGLKDIKMIEVKTGTTEGVTIHQDNSIIKDEPPPGLPAKVIFEGISALKAESPAWPEEAKFSDDAATVFLLVEPLEEAWLNKSRFIPMRLPHPLSLDRSVCYVSTKAGAGAEQVAEITQKFRDAGVLGDIKIIPRGLLDSAVTNNDKKTLPNLVKLYDTHLWDSNARTEGIRQLVALLNTAYKHGVFSSSSNLGLDNTVMCLKHKSGAYFVRVGHTGLSDKQLQENIASVINTIDRNSPGFFPKGLGGIKSLRLVTGVSEGVSIYQNGPVDKKAASRNAFFWVKNTQKWVKRTLPRPVNAGDPDAGPESAKKGLKRRAEAECETSPVSAKKSKKRKENDPEISFVADPETTPLSAKKSKKKKIDPDTSIVADPETTPLSAKKSKKQKENDAETSFVADPETPTQSAKKSKKKKIAEAAIAAEPVSDPEVAPISAKKSKKRKENDPEAAIVADPEAAIVADPKTPTLSAKKSKKRKENDPETSFVADPEAAIVADPETPTLSAKKSKKRKENDPETSFVADPEAAIVADPETPTLSAKKSKKIDPEAVIAADPETPTLSAKKSKKRKENDPETSFVADPETAPVSAKKSKRKSKVLEAN